VGGYIRVGRRVAIEVESLLQLLQMRLRVGAEEGGLAGRRRLAPGQGQLVLRLEQLHGGADARGALRVAARPIPGATGIGDDGQSQWLNSLFVRIDVIDKRLQVLALSPVRILLAHFQARFGRLVIAAPVEDEVVEGFFCASVFLGRSWPPSRPPGRR